MKPHHPSRRRLLGGLVAGLFGWLLPRKAAATPRQPSPPAEPGYTRQERTLDSSSMTTYSQDGDLVETIGYPFTLKPTELFSNDHLS